jgi:hypothetical protein
MINLVNLSINDMLVYVDTTNPDIPYDTNNFLFGFKNGFTNKWTYVCPTIVTQNSRYTVFQIELVTSINQDPINGLVAMSPEGNWDYKLWAIDTPTLSPDYGYLLDEGQAYLEGCEEFEFVTYISNNEAEENIVYLTADCVAECTKWNTAFDQWQFASQKWNECN